MRVLKQGPYAVRSHAKHGVCFLRRRPGPQQRGRAGEASREKRGPQQKGEGSYTTFDGVVSADGEFKAFDGNGLLGELFVDAETDAHRALLLHQNKLINAQKRVR